MPDKYRITIGNNPGLYDGYAPHTSDLLHPGRGAVGRSVRPPGAVTDEGKTRTMRWNRIPKSSLVQVVKYRPSGGGVGGRYFP